MDPILDDITFLVSSEHRVGVLDTLNESPCDRDDLREATGASSPTMGRILTDFDDRRWITKEGRTYHLTDLGEFVVSRLREFRDAIHVERTMRDVWPWLPYEIDGFSVELFTDAVVSRPGPGYPYQPVDRITELVVETEVMRGFGMVMLKSSNLEAFFTRSLVDLQSDYIYPPSVFREILSWDAEAVTEAVAHPNCTVWLHDDLPLSEWCGVCIFDERVSLCCYDPETGSLQATIDTGSPTMRRWAESHYERYRAEARPIKETDDLVPIGSSR